METLPTHQQEQIMRRRKLANQLVTAAERGEIQSLDGISPCDTSIEVVQQIRGILRSQGLLPRPQNDGKF